MKHPIQEAWGFGSTPAGEAAAEDIPNAGETYFVSAFASVNDITTRDLERTRIVLIGSGATFSVYRYDPENTDPENGVTVVHDSEDRPFVRLGTDAAGAAEDVSYDNADSGLAATDVQAAIDELSGKSGLPSGGDAGEFLVKQSEDDGDAIWTASVPKIGINAPADDTNKLSVKSDVVLLSHDDVTPGTGDTRLIINKANTGDSASVLLANDESGRAEIGLTGDDKLHVKVSADGSTWTEAMVIDKATGFIGIGTASPQRRFSYIITDNAHGPMFSRYDESSSGPGLAMSKARGGAEGTPAAVQVSDVTQSFFTEAYDGNAFIPCGNLRWVVDTTVTTGSVPTRIEFRNFTAGVGQTTKAVILHDGTFQPGADNAYTLGQSGARWSAVWAANGTIQTSDMRDKDVIGGLGFAGALVDAVDPVLFRWKVGGNEVRPSETETTRDESGNEEPTFETVPLPGVRAHAGFLAQDIKAAMDGAGVDFGAWGLEDKDDPASRQFMRPDQLVAVLWAALKETREELAALKARV